MTFFRSILAGLLLSGLLLPFTAKAAPNEKSEIQWQQWSPDIFQQARKQDKMVLLDLGAVWCHWCHVMDEQTYKNPAVVDLIQKHFIAVRVDQDSRPDLSNRYGDYGWPATILFKSDGTELAKRKGYLPPRQMSSILEAFVQDPTPGPSIQEETPVETVSAYSLSESVQKKEEAAFRKGYDRKEGAWGFDQKFLNWDAVEFAMLLAGRKDSDGTMMARGTLDAQVKLMDPVWGGVYQYSTDGDWNHPHFEKLLQFQAANIRIYSLASVQWPGGDYLKHALAIENYVTRFLTSPEGAVYTSQDADLIQGQHSAEYFALDDKARRKLGVPRVDKAVYARENGWYIQALVALAGASGDAGKMDKARHLAEWIIKERGLPKGGFRHAAKDEAGPYLDDTLSMGRAFLALYGGTGDRIWLARAGQAADFIEQNFQPLNKNGETPGYLTTVAKGDGIFTGQSLIGENAELARFTNLLFHYDGKTENEAMSRSAMKYLVARAVKVDSGWRAKLLLANDESAHEPLHITVVGSKTDPQAQKLFQIALALPGSYKQTEWLDFKEGALPGAVTEYPQLKSPAAFLCHDGVCSRPLTTSEQLRAFVHR